MDHRDDSGTRGVGPGPVPSVPWVPPDGPGPSAYALWRWHFDAIVRPLLRLIALIDDGDTGRGASNPHPQTADQTPQVARHARSSGGGEFWSESNIAKLLFSRQ